MTDKKIEEITNKIVPHIFEIIALNDRKWMGGYDEEYEKQMGQRIGDVANLVQKEREEAVRGFAKLLDDDDKREGATYYYEYMLNDYLQSLDKGDKDENR